MDFIKYIHTCLKYIKDVKMFLTDENKWTYEETVLSVFQPNKCIGIVKVGRLEIFIRYE